MSTHVTIVKKPSGHNLAIKVTNPGSPFPMEQTLADNQSTEVLVYGDGSILMSEVEKESSSTNAGKLIVDLANLVKQSLDGHIDKEFDIGRTRMRVLVETLPGAGG